MALNPSSPSLIHAAIRSGRERSFVLFIAIQLSFCLTQPYSAGISTTILLLGRFDLLVHKPFAVYLPDEP